MGWSSNPSTGRVVPQYSDRGTGLTTHLHLLPRSTLIYISHPCKLGIGTKPLSHVPTTYCTTRHIISLKYKLCCISLQHRYTALQIATRKALLTAKIEIQQKTFNSSTSVRHNSRSYVTNSIWKHLSKPPESLRQCFI
jgi:hypothetical protein